MAGDVSGEREDPKAGPETDPDIGSVTEEAVKLLGALSGWARDASHGVEEHLAAGAPECPECRWCPICRTVHAVRELSPEVRTQLATAATSLLNAAAGLLATAVPEQRASSGGHGVEHIDLDDTTDWPDEPEEDR